MYKLLFFIGIIIIASCSACGYISGSRNYKITCDYIKGVQPIDRFSIAELDVVYMNSTNTIPDHFTEIKRVSCEIIKGAKERKIIHFHKKNKGYRWFNSTPTNYLNTDSLRNLEIREQLDYLKKKGVVGADSSTVSYDMIPIKFKRNTWYLIFGLENAERSYFMYYNENKNCIVRYAEPGPW